MQIDMHYYGTYAMARAAGINADAARIIATAAQYVDDNVADEPIVLKDGARILRRSTAHHLEDVRKNVNENDQREVWVPFHFLPGNEIDDGENEDHTLRLRCRKNSEPACMMVDHLVNGAPTDVLALERAGIVAHVYADTFSHYGFSGVSSRRNRVYGDRFAFQHEDALTLQLQEWGGDFFKKFGSQGGRFRNIKTWVDRQGFVERLKPLLQRLGLGAVAAWIVSFVGETGSGALGHGPVATYPDQPYLKWSYVYEYPRAVTVERDNSADFLEACRALHAMFERLAAVRGDFADVGGGRPFASIEGKVAQIIGTVGDKYERADLWKRAAATGELFVKAEPIPDYDHETWTRWIEEADGKIDSANTLDHPACRFHLAANAHRSWVLHTLLPSRNLLVA